MRQLRHITSKTQWAKNQTQSSLYIHQGCAKRPTKVAKLPGVGTASWPRMLTAPGCCHAPSPPASCASEPSSP
eukprot:CAMPEP_0173426938 /NCGR_PEP_ID=MMETSP1357-20121228/6270_1 /TAXON_ID=77926 /ORGANISM="Hemiselmis rufescens, Strain PCC563" /LENGTH=72 /DNA_ID=CAMNT_0014390679 /DNA_START=93 /DNA_END=308 /DNA_ORIENTATION=-